jgi:hypothetical protein
MPENRGNMIGQGKSVSVPGVVAALQSPFVRQSISPLSPYSGKYFASNSFKFNILAHIGGALAERFSIVLAAPEGPGVYRVAFYPNRVSEPSAEDDLFVQARISRSEREIARNSVES